MAVKQYRRLYFVGAFAVLLASCATIDLPPEKIKEYQNLTANNCIQVRWVAGQNNIVDRKQIDPESVSYNTLEELGQGWIRLAYTSGKIRRGATYVHTPTNNVICGDRNWPGVEAASTRLGL